MRVQAGLLDVTAVRFLGAGTIQKRRVMSPVARAWPEPERHARKGPPQATRPSHPNTPYAVLQPALNERRNAPEGRLWLPESAPRIAEDREGYRDAGY